eukprot:6239238-Prymnesium_polylepis.1
MNNHSSIVNATGLSGGAIYAEASQVVLMGSSITRSQAVEGGSICAELGSVVIIAGGSLISNSRAEGDGGAVFLHGDATEVRLISSSIQGSAFHAGGAAFIELRAALTVADGSTIRDSHGEEGGAICLVTGALTLTGASSITDSKAEYEGAAIEASEQSNILVANGSGIAR